MSFRMAYIGVAQSSIPATLPLRKYTTIPNVQHFCPFERSEKSRKARMRFLAMTARNDICPTKELHIEYALIVDKAVRRFGIRNFQVLNELNLEYETTCGSRTTIGGYMYNLAYHLKRRAVQAGTYPIYLGFPGPGGSKFSDANWGPYWNDYKTFITRLLDFVADFAYNWLAVHVYGTSEAECEQNLIGAYDDLRVRIPQYPHRYTEWSIPNDVPNRAAAMASALRSFRNHVLNQNDVDVYALHAYISRISDPGSGGDRYGLTPGGGGQVAGVF